MYCALRIFRQNHHHKAISNQCTMVRFHPIAASLLAVVAFSPSTEAFSPTIGSRSHTSNSILAVGVADEDDFDAPSLANPVMSGKVGKLDHDPIVDDECYLGKDNQFDDCVDFGTLQSCQIRSFCSTT